ncbi:hypothetical protein BO94DRAFT_590306 [Aspergillus sclerotioniger CBS 115572]|uniref:Uncharacterized protein n=1 Tax=Aspergillus sclerotioniger CBS 115572 TaxID=1450535 RepID=A0A317V8D0_9EURO|nr:hypothetical protein BO94DRAFT_590306 [Aspergillus sclerotioniger CBS 115572]PWY70396.1 hypothetical protein BO94DRAFT_590306 [Aspergillus sclerotioniger CBS 115572]
MSTIHHPLTEHNLSLHNQHQHIESNPPVPTSTWVDSLIASERVHLFTTQLAQSLSNPPPTNMDIDTDLQNISNLSHDSALSPFKLFEHTYTHHQTVYQETPLERFLTPGYSDPCYVVKSALADMGVQFGSLEGGEKRKKIARANVEVVRAVSASAGRSEGS